MSIARAPVPVHRVHAGRAAYKSWVDEHCTSYAVRWARMDDYDRFVERWPVLQDWFDAPLRQRLLDKENCIRGQHPHGVPRTPDLEGADRLQVFQLQVDLAPVVEWKAHERGADCGLVHVPGRILVKFRGGSSATTGRFIRP